MKIIINDLSFQYQFYTVEQALKRLEQFISVCHYIECGKLKNVEGIFLGEKIDVHFEIAPGHKIISLLQKVLPKEERSYLLGVLVNRGVLDLLPDEPFVFEGLKSFACACAKDEMMVSVLSRREFGKSVICGKIGVEDVAICNLADRQHMVEYQEVLGDRIYRANSGKHKKQRWNAYGKGKVGSPMDLDDEQGQRLLDQAVEYKGRLYARLDGKNYSFQNEQGAYYHGYIDETLGDDVLRKLDQHFRDER